MSHLSRREFLKSSGIAFLVGVAGRLPLALVAGQPEVVYGRALSVLDVCDSPAPTAVVTKRLWPDSVVRIEETVQDWYRLANGYAKRSDIQPMVSSKPTLSTPPLPFWAEVGGAVAVVRRWCAADAPLVARIGHGGVAQVVDRLAGDRHDWYALADEESFLGWSPASVWSPVDEAPVETVDGQLYVNTSVRELQFVENNRPILRAPVALGTTINAGIYSVHQRKHSVMLPIDNASDGYGIPWSIEFGGYSIVGAYWHNDFGAHKNPPGPSVQVAPAVARWLYERLPQGTRVIVR